MNRYIKIVLYFKFPKLNTHLLSRVRLLLKKIKNLFYLQRKSSLEIVFDNLSAGLNKLNVSHQKNIDFEQLNPTDCVIVLGTGKHALEGYNKENKIIAGIGLMTHPAEWPDIFEKYPVNVYLQHSQWTYDIYSKWFGKSKCRIWPAGIDTEFWSTRRKTHPNSWLIYVKFLFNKVQNELDILAPIIQILGKHNMNFQIIRYGSYKAKDYKRQLSQTKGMIFLCEHESQGMAYQEALSMNVPVLAWDQGLWLDPKQSAWGENTPVLASSVPYFDDSCGVRFKSVETFEENLELFESNIEQNKFNPRAYILQHLSLEKSAEKMLNIINEVYSQ